MVTTRPKMLLLAMSGFMAQMELGYVLVSSATGVHSNYVLNHMLKYESHDELAPILTGTAPHTLES